MMMLPFQILGIWLRGLLSVLFLGVGSYLLWCWYDQERPVVENARVIQPEVRQQNDVMKDEGAQGREIPVQGRVIRSRWHLGLDRETAYLVGGLAMILASLGGGSLGYPLLRRREGSLPAAINPSAPAPEQHIHRVRRPDGTELVAVSLGRTDGPVIVMTHGWGVDSAEWAYSRDQLAENHGLILWDLPGLGQSSRPSNNDFSLEKMAHDLDAIVGLAKGRPVILLGHSIGGMIGLTYSRLFPQALGSRVSGLILVHTTYTNPVKTTAWGGFYSAIQKPVLEPLCYVMIGLAPLVWAMNWLSYLNGSIHRSTDRSSFSGNETREQLDLASRFGPKAWPGVIARGMLAMFRYDATATLPTIGVPTLVIAGDQDDMTRPEASATMAQVIPGATIHKLSPAKHMGHMEHHREFVTTIERFIAENVEKKNKAFAGKRGQ